MPVNTLEIQLKKQVAIDQFNNGCMQDAIQTCEEICQCGYDDPIIFCLLGMIYGNLNQLYKSIHYSRKALQIDPEYIDAHYNLGLALRQLGSLEEAGRELEYVIHRDAGNVNAHHALGYIKMMSGQYQQAAGCFRNVMRLDPGNLDAVAGEAEVYEKQGEPERAYRILQGHINGELVNARIAIVYGSLAGTLGDINAGIERLKHFLNTREIDSGSRMQLCFILGKLFDQNKMFDSAFRYYEEANRLKGLSFDSCRYESSVNRAIDMFSKSTLARLPRSGNRSDLPLFIVGMPRSGTSLVEQILSSHRDVYGAGELGEISKLVELLFPLMRDMPGEHGITPVLTKAHLDDAANRYIDKLLNLTQTAERVTDKMPLNFMHLGYIQLMFPNARVIHCRRNALDTCLSCYFQDFTAAHDYSFGLEDLGHYYQGYRKLMKHWDHVLHLPIYNIQYEDLVSSPEDEIRRLLEFCGLDWDEHCLSHNENRRVTRTASYSQANKPIYVTSVNRWENYREHLDELVHILDEPFAQ